MPVGRIILKSISDSRRVSNLKTDGARLLYTWLITHLDVNGCYSGDAEVIKGKVFTRLKKSTKTIEDYLVDIENQDPPLVVRYQANGDVFLNVPDFVDKQPSLNRDREGKTTIPLPTPDLVQTLSVVTPPEVKLSKDKISKENVKNDKNKESVEYKLSEHLLDMILNNNPEYKKPDLSSWSKYIDLMIRIDKRKPNDIEDVIDWCQADDFWYKNILSTKKLREKYDRLYMSMNSKPSNKKESSDEPKPRTV